jgi:hypothetical protein
MTEDENQEHTEAGSRFGDLYAQLLIVLCERNQGELFIPIDSKQYPPGTLMHRHEPGGVRLRFVPDKEPH